VKTLRVNAAAKAVFRDLPMGFIMIGNDTVKVCTPQNFIEGPSHSDSVYRIFFADEGHVSINNIDTPGGEAEAFIAELMNQCRAFKLYEYLYGKLKIQVTYYPEIIDDMISQGKLNTTEVHNESL
jgi:hypothetical protein